MAWHAREGWIREGAYLGSPRRTLIEGAACERVAYITEA
jgi:hypothetical protein